MKLSTRLIEAWVPGAKPSEFLYPHELEQIAIKGITGECDSRPPNHLHQAIPQRKFSDASVQTQPVRVEELKWRVDRVEIPELFNAK